MLVRRCLRALVELAFKPSNAIASKSRSDFFDNSITATTNKICGWRRTKQAIILSVWIRFSTILGQHVYYIGVDKSNGMKSSG